jgi:DNA adenine methylase
VRIGAAWGCLHARAELRPSSARRRPSSLAGWRSISYSRAVSSVAAVHPLLRWAGSKRGLLAELTARTPEGLSRYIEPFAGSACLFFELAPGRAVLGDMNHELITTYRVVRDEPHAVAAQVHAWGHDPETYYAVRALDRANLGEIETAARFIYLNRLCFNGVYRTNRRGQFNVPYGSRPGAVPHRERFVACAELLGNAELRAGDFADTVADADAGEGDFVYLDPPYSRAVSDAYGVYGYGSFDAGDLDRLLTCLRDLDRRGAKVLLSYTHNPRLAELGERWRIEEVAVRSQVGGVVTRRSTRRELLVANYGHN